MRSTFNTKIIVFVLVLILVTVAISAAYITDSVDFADKDFVFIPLIVGLLLTMIRTYNNITEKYQVVMELADLREASLDQKKISFDTCPDYWTKNTRNGAVYCTNQFADRDDELNYIGGHLKKVSTPVDEALISDDSASNIGFAFAAHTEVDGKNNFKDPEFTYIPKMRSSSNVDVEEPFTEDSSAHDTVPHKHTRTFVDYAHSDKPVEWKDGEDRAHDTSAYKDGDHLLIYNEDVYHDHSGNGNLYDASGNLIWGRAVVASSEMSQEPEEDVSKEFNNRSEWISPRRKSGSMHAEINLSELNKKENKCHLVKNFNWEEAKRKCGNVNVTFDQ